MLSSAVAWKMVPFLATKSWEKGVELLVCFFVFPHGLICRFTFFTCIVLKHFQYHLDGFVLRLTAGFSLPNLSVVQGMKEAQEKLTGDAFKQKHLGDEL